MIPMARVSQRVPRPSGGHGLSPLEFAADNNHNAKRGPFQAPAVGPAQADSDSELGRVSESGGIDEAGVASALT